MSEEELTRLLTIWNTANTSKSVLIDGTVVYVKTWQDTNIQGCSVPILGFFISGASVEKSKITTVWCKDGFVIAFKNENI